jgi:CRP-like cAMP-binding protein
MMTTAGFERRRFFYWLLATHPPMRRIDLTKAQAARSSTIRDINRQFVLNYIRDREPISRAEIARSTELQRSTVSTIVEELKDEGLIEEIGAGASTGGRDRYRR